MPAAREGVTAWRNEGAEAQIRRTGAPAGDVLTVPEAWSLLRRAMCGDEPTPILAEADVHLSPGSVGAAFLRTAWRADRPVADDARIMLDLYLPICLHARSISRPPFVIAHLGQSLDGRIATPCGDSEWVTGQDNLAHMHRLRALCDAVMIGAGTVRSDDPRLTVRTCEGGNPIRAVIDIDRRLGVEASMFSDGAAQTLLLCDADLTMGGDRHGQAEVVGIPRTKDRLGTTDRLAPAAILSALASRGVRSVFLEGGGITVSRFVEAECVNRLQVTIAPTILGSGRPGLGLPPAPRMGDARRPPARTIHQGADILFDCILDA